MGHESGQDCDRVLTLYKQIMAKHFQHFKTTRRYFSVWKKVVFYQETERFLPIIGDKSQKSDWNWRVWLQMRVRAILSALAQMSRAKGDVSTWQMLLGVWVRLELTEPLWWRCNHLSQQWKPNSLRARSPFKGYLEESHASGTRKETREQGVGKESDSSAFPLPLTASPLTRAFACYSKWRDCSQSIIFIGNRACSLFGEPVYIRSCEEKVELFTY